MAREWVRLTRRRVEQTGSLSPSPRTPRLNERREGTVGGKKRKHEIVLKKKKSETHRETYTWSVALRENLGL